ncbi:MAG: DEAD/DEAH box helicase [Amaricoccus sp.]
MFTCQGRLPKALARTLSARGYRRLTPVQRAVLRVGPADADLLVSARTGSGKTVAYGLALARRLFEDAGAPFAGPRALVVTPTRELAVQVRGELGWLLADTGVRIGCCTGGADLRGERAALAAGLDLVVGTPGRLNDHLRQGGLVADAIRAVVLDEADDMLLPDFGADLEALLGALPARRQMLLFSATIGPRAEALARRFQVGALRLDIGAAKAVETPLQAVAVAAAEREAVIVSLLRLHEARGAMVFCNRREEVERLARCLGARGFRVAALSGALSQPRRAAALAAMRDGQAQVCVATDVAARGIDLPGLGLVLHADLPVSAEVLLHRSGRTGRAGRAGLAVLVVPQAERRRARALAGRAGLALDWVPPPSGEALRAEEFRQMLAELPLAEALDAADRALADGLVGAHPPERLAAALVRMWRGERERLKERVPVGLQRRGGGTWFAVALPPGDRPAEDEILARIARLGRIALREIRRVRVVGAEVQVEIARMATEAFAAAAGNAARRLPAR